MAANFTSIIKIAILNDHQQGRGALKLLNSLKSDILNADIRPEFVVIRDYFAKASKKKLVAVKIIVKYTDSQIIAPTAIGEIKTILRNIKQKGRQSF